jgi:hypothetical protein
MRGVCVVCVNVHKWVYVYSVCVPQTHFSLPIFHTSTLFYASQNMYHTTTLHHCTLPLHTHCTTLHIDDILEDELAAIEGIRGNIRGEELLCSQVCVCVCIWVCVSVRCMYMSVCECACVCIWVCGVWVCVCMYVYECVWVCLFAGVCGATSGDTNWYIPKCVFAIVMICVNIYECVQVYECVKLDYCV